MMPHHDSQHEELIQVLVTGDLDPASPKVAELQACPVCQERLQSLSSLTDLLHAAGREQRSILSEELGAVPLPGADRMSGAVRKGLRERAQPQMRVSIPWLALAAALVIGVFVGFRMMDGSAGTAGNQPPDRLLHIDEVWPAGSDVATLTEKGFQWPGHPDESYELLLFSPSNPLRAWRVIPCEGNECPIDAALEAKMRAAGTTWMWRYERTSPQQPGSRSVAMSQNYEFSFSQ